MRGKLALGESKTPVAEINMVPMIDIMLVLLVIFIITAPLLTHSVKLELPQASSQVNELAPRSLMLSLDAQGRYYLNGVRQEKAQFQRQLQGYGAQAQPPSVQLYVDKQIPYEQLAQVLAELSANGLSKIAFVSQPAS